MREVVVEFQAGFRKMDVRDVESSVGSCVLFVSIPLIDFLIGKAGKLKHTDITTQAVLLHLSDVVDLVQDL